MAHSKVVASDQAASHGQDIAEQLKAEVSALQSDLVELSEGCDRERLAHQQVNNIIYMFIKHNASISQGRNACFSGTRTDILVSAFQT